MQNLCYDNEYDLHENEPVGRTQFGLNGFCRTNIRFNTAVNYNSENNDRPYFMLLHSVWY